MEQFRRFKVVLISAIVVFVLLVVGVSIGNIIWSNIYSVTLNIVVAPADSRVLINDKIEEVGEKRIKPGEYVIEVLRDGFETESLSFVFQSGDTQEVAVALIPNDPSTMDWYETHEEDAAIVDGILGQEYANMAAEMVEKYDIVEDLPVRTYGYILGYGNCEENGGPDFCVVIKAEFGYRDEAVEYLQKTGKDMAKYYVEIEDYSSPFAKVAINVPDGLTFDAGADSWLNDQVLETDSDSITAVIKSRISQLANIYDMAKVASIKCFGGGKYCGVKVAVYDEEKYDEAEGEGEINPDDMTHDTYRMIIAKVDGTWRVVSDLKFLLDYDSNPKLPREVVKLVDEL